MLPALLLLAGCSGDRADQPPAHEATARKPALAAVPTGPAVPDTGAAPDQSPPPPAPSRPVPVPAPMDSYRAIGTEPFWAVTISGTRATLERLDHATDHFTVARTDDGGTLRYRGDGFAMAVTPGPCSDGMSDAIWSDRVQIAFAAGTLKGCGGAREEMPEGPP